MNRTLHCVIQDMIHYEINDEKYDPESSITLCDPRHDSLRDQ